MAQIKKIDIPIRVLDNGAIQTDPKIVLDKWKQDLKDPYSKHDVANEFDDGFCRYCMLQKEFIESETRGDDNKALNGTMSEDEIL